MLMLALTQSSCFLRYSDFINTSFCMLLYEFCRAHIRIKS